MGNAQGGFAAAKALCDNGQFAEAVPLLEQVYRQQRGSKQQPPSSAAAAALLECLAVACEETGRFERAAQVWSERRALEERMGLVRREETAVSRFGQARTFLWLGKFLAAAELLDAALLDGALLGTAPQLLLALAQYFLSVSSPSGSAEWRRKALQSAERSVAERESGPPALLVTALLVQHAIALAIAGSGGGGGGERAELLRRAYGVVALSPGAREDVERLVRKNLSFLALHLAREGSAAAAERAERAGELGCALLERLELRRTLAHAEALFALGMARAQSDRAGGAAALGEAKEMLGGLAQGHSPLYGRVTYELGALLLEMRRGKEALLQLEECLAFYKDRESDGHARSLVAFMQALQMVGDTSRSEAARQQQAQIAASAKFATFSRKTQAALMQSLGGAVAVPPAPAEEDEAPEVDDFEAFESTFVFAAAAAKPEPVKVNSPPAQRSPAVSPRIAAERNRGRRGSVVDLFGGAVPANHSPVVTPRNVSPRPEPPERPDKAAAVIAPPPRDDSETMKVALRQMRKDILPKDLPDSTFAPPPRDDSESMRVTLSNLRSSVVTAEIFSCPFCGAHNAAAARTCTSCSNLLSK